MNAAPIRIHARHVRAQDELQDHVDSAQREVQHVIDDLGVWEDDPDALHALQIADVALRFLMLKRPTQDRRAIIARLYAALIDNPAREHPGRPWISIPELGRLMGVSRFQAKRELDNAGIPYAAPTGKRNYRVMIADLEKWPAWQGVRLVRGYERHL